MHSMPYGTGRGPYAPVATRTRRPRPSGADREP
jgi:hypothetical protein